MNSEKLSMSFEVCPADAEGPTEWFPAVSRDDALLIVDRAIAGAEGHLRKLQRMRDLILATE